MTNWSPQQDRALVKVDQWLKNPGDKQLFRLFGYAGTGKTTLAKHLASGIGGTVLFAAYTGKATSVLRASGAPNTSTLHSLIYTPKERSKERLNGLKQELGEVQEMIHEHISEERDAYFPDPVPVPKNLQARVDQLKIDIKREERSKGTPGWDLKWDSPLRTASLLVVDECSMVDEQMAGDIMSYGKPVLVLGDPAQLPPVTGEGFFTAVKPDIMLTEIHRQARDNPIIELATRVREGHKIDLGQYGESSVILRATPELALDADQVLVGRNKTRTSTNKRMRSLKNFTEQLPMEGEKLVCLRNDKDLGLLNGTLHTVTADSEEFGGYVNLRIRPEESTDDNQSILVPAHKEHFYGNPDDIGYWEKRNAQEFTYGYALTVHKSQGSQWGKVLIIDESSSFSKDRKNWLYTAITRAADKVTIVRG